MRVTTGAVIALLTLANLAAAARLIGDIITTNRLFANNATGLLATGGVIWATNVSAIKRWAKLLMMTEAVVSLGIGVLVIARAVNVPTPSAALACGRAECPDPGFFELKRDGGTAW